MKRRELIIIGGGPAGMAAALEAKRSGVKDILIIERDFYLGGILNQCIHPGFGLHQFNEELTGPEYACRFIAEIEKTPGIDIWLNTIVVSLNHKKELIWLRPGSIGKIRARSVIVATGCRERTREMIHTPGDRPSGIFPAGLVQKLINMKGLIPGKEVVIIGSGDIGLIMARRLTLEGVLVKAVVEIASESKGLIRNVVQCLDDYNIPLYLNHTISRINGAQRVESIDIIKVSGSGEPIEGSQFNIECDTVLYSVGLIPENELLEMAGAQIDQESNIPIAEQLNETSLPGIFVCGNAAQVYDLADWVTRDSFRAGQQAAEFLGLLVKKEAKNEEQ